MCGIVGVATASRNGLQTIEADMFRDMLVMDTLRGWDSTGVFGVDRHSNVLICKEASHAANFVQTKEFKDFREDAIRHGMFVVGHNRAATKGSVNDKNAHPFWINDKIILVQNGTYKGSHKHLKDTEVDTEALAHVIAEEDDVEKALQRINAAYALVWFNTETHKLHMIRNDERPLFVAYNKVNNSMYWASEPGFITAAAARNGIQLQSAPYLLAPGNLYTMTIEGSTWSGKGEDLDIKYRFPQSSQVQTIYNEEYWEGYGEQACGFTPGNTRRHNFYSDCASNEVLDVTAKNVKSLPFHGGPEDTSVSFAEIFADKDNVGDFGTEAEITQVVTEHLELISGQRRVAVELMDCLPANHHPQCTKWHVWGYVMDPSVDPDVKAQVLVHWIVSGKTKSEIIDYVCNYLYTVTPSSTVTRKAEYHGAEVHFATMYGGFPEATPIKQQEATNNVH